jgi:hypothetical protein
MQTPKSLSKFGYRKINFYVNECKAHFTLWKTGHFLGKTLWKTLGKTQVTCGILFKFPQPVENSAILSTSFPQAGYSSKPYIERVLKSFPQFPQPLL